MPFFLQMIEARLYVTGQGDLFSKLTRTGMNPLFLVECLAGLYFGSFQKVHVLVCGIKPLKLSEGLSYGCELN